MRPFFAVVRWVLLVQAGTIVTVAAGTWLLSGWPDARSALLGGLTAFLPNLYFASRFGVTDHRRTTKDVLRIFYLGETVKLLLTAALFFILFQFPDIRFIPLFIGFTAVLAVFWFALLARS